MIVVVVARTITSARVFVPDESHVAIPVSYGNLNSKLSRVQFWFAILQESPLVLMLAPLALAWIRDDVAIPPSLAVFAIPLELPPRAPMERVHSLRPSSATAELFHARAKQENLRHSAFRGCLTRFRLVHINYRLAPY